MKKISGLHTELSLIHISAEDIYTADHQVDADGQRTLYFAKDALVATVTTDADGYATVKNLPLGRYYVKAVSYTHLLCL